MKSTKLTVTNDLQLLGVKEVRQLRTKWLDGPGESTTYYFTSSAIGLRLHVMKMDNETETTIKIIRGDGRSIHFVTFETVTIPDSDGPSALYTKIDEMLKKTSKMRRGYK